MDMVVWGRIREEGWSLGGLLRAGMEVFRTWRIGFINVRGGGDGGEKNNGWPF